MTSLWLDGTPVAARAALDRDMTADAVIVGGGIAGISVAYALAREGATVVVLERGELAEGASGRNAGFVLGGVAENYVAACRAYGTDRATRVFRFTFANRVLLRSAIRVNQIDCLAAWNGSDQLAGDDEEWLEIAESARQLASHGVRVRLEPAERKAVYDEDGEVHPVRFVRGLADAAERTRGTSRRPACARCADRSAQRRHSRGGSSCARRTRTAATGIGASLRPATFSSAAGATPRSRRRSARTTGRATGSSVSSTRSFTSTASMRR
jgi:glycine/D-amino acid oxidase-like deaminating enzyme